ncbi:hypothetical protein HK098_003583 [Nowakowskiella sp. JEL0407]|nr:hypothetical protein HK098_003583 [Nowakowskiella sp. JEL0407]
MPAILSNADSDPSNFFSEIISAIITFITGLFDPIKDLFSKIIEFFHNFDFSVLLPYFIAICIGALSFPLLFIWIIALFGFTWAGIQANSFASTIQTPFTAAGSVFAWLQSIGARGLVSFFSPVGIVWMIIGAILGVVCEYYQFHWCVWEFMLFITMWVTTSVVGLVAISVIVSILGLIIVGLSGVFGRRQRMGYVAIESQEREQPAVPLFVLVLLFLLFVVGVVLDVMHTRDIVLYLLPNLGSKCPNVCFWCRRRSPSPPSPEDLHSYDSELSDTGSDYSFNAILRPLTVLRRRVPQKQSPKSTTENSPHSLPPIAPIVSDYNSQDEISDAVDSTIDSVETIVNSAPSKPAKVIPEVKLPHKSERKRPEKYSHSFLVHSSIRASPLSKESPEQNYRGFYNLAMLLLFVLNVRLIIENWLKYGLLLKFFTIFEAVQFKEIEWMFTSLLVCTVSILIAFVVEKVELWRDNRGRVIGWVFNSIRILCCGYVIGVPTWISWYKIIHPGVSVFPLFLATILFLKLISYFLVNHDLRLESPHSKKKSTTFRFFSSTQHSLASPTSPSATNASGEAEEVRYPDNITLYNLMYFVLAPTLSYQASYPKTERFRKSFFLKRVLEFFVTSMAMYFLAAQYAAPTLYNSIESLEQMQIGKLVERILKLSVVSVLMWLLMFYCFFHSLMNMMAEVLRFGDRRFYEPWWNASDIATYWRLWNLPVYNWGKRHIYLPLIINYKVPSWLATLVVFTVSAVLHELLIGVPVKNLSGWAFWGMMGQIPLMFFTKIWDRIREQRFGRNKEFFDTLGNLIFWLSFTIVGQPTCIMLYYFNYYTEHRGKAGGN